MTPTLTHPNWITLNAGKLQAFFDPETTALRCITLNGVEVLRSIYAAVRGPNWNTILPRIATYDLVQQDDEFQVQIRVECIENEVNFEWEGVIQGRSLAEGGSLLSYSFDGVAKSEFLRNRIGFCVLHPLDHCVGRPCRIEHASGEETASTLPRLIAPHQPFRDIRAITHEPTEDVSVRVEFEGEVFEMEDQRNWIDASFKTYCTPLEIPYPVLVSAGTKVHQRVTVEVIGNPAEIPLASKGEESAPWYPLPSLGLGMASHGQPITDQEAEDLRKLNLSHLRFDLSFEVEAWDIRLNEAAAQASQLQVELEVALLQPAQLLSHRPFLAEAIQWGGVKIKRWLVFPSPGIDPEELSQISAALREITPSAQIVGGTNANFTELNRERPPADSWDGVTYSVNPQVHAFDDISVMETLEALPMTVETAASIYPGVPITISPITLRPRFNAVQTREETVTSEDALPFSVDARQAEPICAAWTLTAVIQAALKGVSSVTLFETTGWRGVMDAADPNLSFLVTPGFKYPVYKALRTLGQFLGGEVQVEASSGGSGLLQVQLRKGDLRMKLVVNLTAYPQEVEEAISSFRPLEPYETAWIMSHRAG